MIDWHGLWPLAFSGQAQHPSSPTPWTGAGFSTLATAPRFGVPSLAVPGVVADSHAGISLSSFGDDFYDRIHVQPRSLNLGNLSSVQQREVRVWNAFRARALRLVDTPLLGGEGISVSAPGSLPLPFAPLSERAWAISVSTQGPPMIAAELRFVFAGFASLPVIITGQRIVPWAFSPDWATGITERLQWRTDLLRSPTGMEQRRALRSVPRRSFEARMVVEGRERRELDLAMFGWGARIWAMPIWPDGQWLSQSHAAGVQVITCDPRQRDFRAGGLVMLRGPTTTQVEVAEVESLATNAIQLRHPTQQAWPPGTRLYPARVARLAEPPQLTRLTDRASAVAARFDVLEACEWPLPVGTAMYRGTPVLEARPDETEDLSHSWQRLLLTLDNETSAPFVMDPPDLAFPVQAHRWKLHGRGEQATARSWLYALHGRQRAIWVPTHADDLTLQATAASNATAIDVENIGYARFAASRSGRCDIRIERRQGAALHRRITAATAVDAQVERLTLDTALGVELRIEDVHRISYLALCRNDSDEVELHHHTDSDGVAEATVMLRAVRDDAPTP